MKFSFIANSNTLCAAEAHFLLMPSVSVCLVISLFPINFIIELIKKRKMRGFDAIDVKKSIFMQYAN